MNACITQAYETRVWHRHDPCILYVHVNNKFLALVHGRDVSPTQRMTLTPSTRRYNLESIISQAMQRLCPEPQVYKKGEIVYDA